MPLWQGPTAPFSLKAKVGSRWTGGWFVIVGLLPYCYLGLLIGDLTPVQKSKPTVDEFLGVVAQVNSSFSPPPQIIDEPHTVRATVFAPDQPPPGVVAPEVPGAISKSPFIHVWG